MVDKYLERHSDFFRSGEMIAWIAVFLLLVVLLQFYVPYPVDDDTAYHFAVGQLIRKYGILHDFPWTRFSWQHGSYADKEFLFHLLFMPLAGLDFNTASRMVGILGGTLILTTVYLILRAESVRYAGVWALLPMGASIFVYRFAQVRPHLFSIALALIMIWAYVRDRRRVLVMVAILYPLTYVAFWQIPLILIVAAESARMAAGEKFSWKPLVVVTGGLLLGILLHPNAWNLIKINWIHMSDILFRNAWGEHVEFNLGEEFEPFSVQELARYLALTITMACGALVMAWRDRRTAKEALAFVFVTCLFGLLTLRTNRFLEYFVPFSVLSLATANKNKNREFLAVALLGASIFYTLLLGTGPWVSLRSFQLKNWRIEPEVSEVLNKQLSADAKVFTCGWEYTGSLLLNLPERKYMVALDPTLLYKKDPELYNLWYRTLLDAPTSSSDIIRRNFDSRYVVCLDHPTLHPFFDALISDDRVKVLLANGKWVVVDLGAIKDTQ